MTDDQVALLGCAVALVVSGGFVAFSYPLGRVLRGASAKARHERRTVSFQTTTGTAVSSETTRDEQRRAA